MIDRAAVVGAALAALIVAVLFSAGLGADVLLNPFQEGGLHFAPALLLGSLIVYVASAVFLLWKFDLQPRLNGFLFNQTQNPKRVERMLKGVPTFYDTGNPTEFGWVAEIERQAPSILEEIRAFLNEQAGAAREGFRTAYHNKILALGDSWRAMNLVSYGTVNDNSSALPRTVEILSRAPHFFGCNLSRMAPHSRLKFHAGESTCYIRCHLGVAIPAAAPTTALHVGGEPRSWEEGKVRAFCDAHWHGAVNDADEARYVLIFDVMPDRLGWYTKQYCALMVSVSVTQYLLPGRLSLDEPLWHPGVLVGYVALSTVGLPILAGFYLYFRYLCKARPNWMRRLADSGFAFYF
jgi:ornithine lipid ester-linked acyl 2-hydroxylase